MLVLKYYPVSCRYLFYRYFGDQKGNQKMPVFAFLLYLCNHF